MSATPGRWLQSCGRPSPRNPPVALEYVEVRDAIGLEQMPRIDGDVLVAIAARVGQTRLIDNIRLSVRGDAVTVDLGTGWTEPVRVSGEP